MHKYYVKKSMVGGIIIVVYMHAVLIRYWHNNIKKSIRNYWPCSCTIDGRNVMWGGVHIGV